MVAYGNAQEKNTLEIHCLYLGNKEIYWILKTCSVLFSTKCHLFDNFIFLCSNNVFINHALKFKSKPGHLTVNLGHSDFSC
jgi:hypothetical protein